MSKKLLSATIVSKWDVDDVLKWFVENGFGDTKTKSYIRRKKINGKQFLKVPLDQVKQFGLHKVKTERLTRLLDEIQSTDHFPYPSDDSFEEVSDKEEEDEYELESTNISCINDNFSPPRRPLPPTPISDYINPNGPGNLDDPGELYINDQDVAPTLPPRVIDNCIKREETEEIYETHSLSNSPNNVRFIHRAADGRYEGSDKKFAGLPELPGRSFPQEPEPKHFPRLPQPRSGIRDEPPEPPPPRNKPNFESGSDDLAYELPIEDEDPRTLQRGEYMRGIVSPKPQNKPICLIKPEDISRIRGALKSTNIEKREPLPVPPTISPIICKLVTPVKNQPLPKPLDRTTPKVPTIPIQKVAMKNNKWFQAIERNEAEKQLKDIEKNGGFVVRPSTKHPDRPYTLCVYVDGNVKNIPIRKNSKGKYALGTKEKPNEITFYSYSELVEYFTNHPIEITNDGNLSKSVWLVDVF